MAIPPVMPAESLKSSSSVPASPRLVSLHDIVRVLLLPALAAAAWTIPEAAWRPLARAIAELVETVISRSRRDIIDCVRRTAGRRPLPRTPREIAVALAAAEIERNLQTMRDHRPGRWRPEVVLVGREHIDAGLGRGRGVILWDSHFYFAATVTKMALFRAGLELVHLSHPRHGFSSTRFGMRVLNPVRTRSERRYLGERVVMSLDGPVAAMRTLLERLGDNRVVSITVRGTGRDPSAVPFLDGTLRIATGAPDLAYRSGASLLPVFTIRADDGRFVTTVEPPIAVTTELPRRRAADQAARDYVSRLEPYVLRHPDQWVDWINI